MVSLVDVDVDVDVDDDDDDDDSMNGQPSWTIMTTFDPVLCR
jgi:hypothetical protein